MNERSIPVHEFECDGCHNRFEIVMTFRQREPFDRDAQGTWRPTGYPELQPECPHCHSHDIVRVVTHEIDGVDEPK